MKIEDYKNNEKYKVVEKEDEYLIYEYIQGDLRGCVAIGNELKDINGDKHIDILDSRKAMNSLLNQITVDEIEVEIK